MLTKQHTEMQETQEELALKVRALQKEVERLKTQLKEKRFGLTWIDVPEAFEKESENKIPVFEEVPEFGIHNNDGKPTHILIEGDNYHALTCLSYTHRGNIDVIYIDPPYNTGKNDFVYRDKRFLKEFPDGTSIPQNHPLRHSAWLSFMEKRLKLAKELLSDKGVIFISIDDNELANLKLLCDEVFVEKNFLGHIHWRRRHNQPNDKTKLIALVAEHIIVYAKNALSLKEFGIGKVESTGSFSNPDNDPKGAWTTNPWKAAKGRGGSKYEIITPTGVILNETWYGTKETFEQYMMDGRVHWTNKGNGIPRIKIYQKDVEAEGQCANNWWVNSEYGCNQDASDEMKAIFNGLVPFDNPKPSKLIKAIVRLGCIDKSSTILDFFAGSGTTLHAVMQLNEEDEGKRQCILCQINEANICKDVTYERNKRVMQGYQDSKGKDVAGLGNSLKYYRTAFVGKNQPKSATDDDKLSLSKKAGCLLGLAENTLYETLSTDYYQFYTDEHGSWTCIYYQEDYSHFEEFRQKVVKLEGMEKNVYVFSWTNGEEFAAEFEFENNVTVKSIPQPILDIYKSLNT